MKAVENLTESWSLWIKMSRSAELKATVRSSRSQNETLWITVALQVTDDFGKSCSSSMICYETILVFIHTVSSKIFLLYFKNFFFFKNLAKEITIRNISVIINYHWIKVYDYVIMIKCMVWNLVLSATRNKHREITRFSSDNLRFAHSSWAVYECNTMHCLLVYIKAKQPNQGYGTINQLPSDLRGKLWH